MYIILWKDTFGPQERTLETSTIRNTLEQGLSHSFESLHQVNVEVIFMSILITIDGSKSKMNIDFLTRKLETSTVGFGQRSSIALSLYLVAICLAKRYASLALWCTPLISALRRQRQADL